jgi:capsular exopolysaccharide synthesis family protein
MSHIFDALQRSETERAGAGTPAPPAATEILERTERQALAQWGSEEAVRTVNEGTAANPVLRIGKANGAGAAFAASRASRGEPARPEALPEVFAQFRDLEISVPAHSRLVSLTATETSGAEAFRVLGVRLRHLRNERPLKKLLVTSTTPQEGKSTVAANLACTMAAGGQQRILLLDGDLRRPALSGMFDLDQVLGVCEYLRGKNPVTTCIYHLRRPGIWIMPSGAVSANPLELMQSKALPALMEQLTAWFDWIIIDSPPVIPLADTSIWARLADGTLLVTRTGQTKKGYLQKGLELLDPAKLVGALVNSSRNSDESDYYYYKSKSAPAEVSG